MPEAVRVTLEPTELTVQSGGETAEAVATVQNLGEVLDQYDLEIEGLDRAWYTIHAQSVGLFPGDNSQVRISLHPPKRSDIRAGDYPFLVKATSQVSSERSSAAKAILKIQPFAVFKAEMNPQRVTGRRGGGYRLTISNSGSVDLTLDLKAADREAGCHFSYNPETVLVAPGEKAAPSVNIHPKRGWLIGPTKAYDFTVTVAPQGARGDVKTVNGSFVHRPLLPSWQPVWSVIKTIIVIGLLLAGLTFAYRLGGGISGYQAGIGRLWNQAKSFVVGSPGQGSSGTPAAPTAVSGPLVYTEGFKLLHDAEPNLVGDPIENVSYDRVGNGYQNSTRGTIFWLKATNTVYFLTTDAVYVFRDGRAEAIDKTRR